MSHTTPFIHLCFCSEISRQTRVSVPFTSAWETSTLPLNYLCHLFSWDVFLLRYPSSALQIFCFIIILCQSTPLLTIGQNCFAHFTSSAAPAEPIKMSHEEGCRGMRPRATFLAQSLGKVYGYVNQKKIQERGDITGLNDAKNRKMGRWI